MLVSINNARGFTKNLLMALRFRFTLWWCNHGTAFDSSDYYTGNFVALLWSQQKQSCIVILFYMSETENNNMEADRTRTIRDLANTPFKKAMLIVQLISYVLIVGSPLIGGFIGRSLGLKASHTGGLILGVFIAGEVLFYGSLAFLGKELVLLIRDKMKGWFKKKKRASE